MRIHFQSETAKPLVKSIGAIALGCLIFAYLSIFEHTLIDDAFITFQYASNLRYYNHWGFLVDQPSNTVTSPLNVVLIALSSFLAPDIPRAAIWLASLESLILLGALLLISHKTFGGYYFGILCFTALLTNPLLMSTLGLEPLLYATLLVVCLCLFMYRQWYALAIVLALLTLTRADGILLFGVMLFFIPTKPEIPDSPTDSSVTPIRQDRFTIKTHLLFSFVYLLCISPWYIFSWVYFGSALPETFFLKTATSWGNATFGSGIQLYYSRYHIATLFSFFLLLGIPLSLFAKNVRANQLLAVSLIFGLVYYFAYSLLHVAPYHWYLAPVAVICVFAGTWAISTLYYANLSRSRLRKMFYAVPVLTALGMILFLLRSGFPPAQAPIHSNWATMDQYQEIGVWLKDNVEPTSKIRLDGETGTIAFYSQRLVYNYFGCRQDTQFRLHKFDNISGIVGPLLSINFLFQKPSNPCGPYDYDLVFNLDPTLPSSLSGTVVKQWNISSTWAHAGIVYLVKR